MLMSTPPYVYRLQWILRLKDTGHSNQTMATHTDRTLLLESMTTDKSANHGKYNNSSVSQRIINSN